MTFSFQPHRSSSDDDALDQHLNDWVAGSETNSELMSNHAADALEFHRMAERAVRTDLAAMGPAAGTWNRVLRNSSQETSKGTREMSTATLSSPSIGFSNTPRESAGQSIRRYSNMAATIALVLAVAVGGWLAMSQMSPGGEGRFAAAPGTPETAQAQTCDVEPMTVDEVMEIVKNPYAGIDWQEGPSHTRVKTIRDLASRKLVEEPIIDFDLSILDGEHSVPDESDFQRATTVADRFLACLQFGNTGQIFKFFDPRTVQGIVLREYPVFRDEEHIRSDVEVVLDYPAAAWVAPYAEALSATDLTYTSNPDRKSSGAYQFPQNYAERYDATRIIVVGTRVTNEDGDVVFQNDVDGRSNPIGTFRTTDRLRLMLIKSSLTGDWIVAAVIPE